MKKWKQFELDVARKLSIWWTTNEEDKKKFAKCKAVSLPFRRTPISGGWSTEKLPLDMQVPLDFDWLVELKCAEGWTFESLLKDLSGDVSAQKSGKRKTVLAGWYEQAQKSFVNFVASLGENSPTEKMYKEKWKDAFLVFTKKYQPTYVMIDNVWIKCFDVSKLVLTKMTVDGTKEIAIMLLDDFLKISSVDFRKNANTVTMCKSIAKNKD